MQNITATDVVLIIGAIFTGIISVINAWKTAQNTERLKEVKVTAAVNQNIATDNQDKLEKIHNLTDGNLSEYKIGLERANVRIDYLHRIINELVDELPPGRLAEIKKRKTDSIIPESIVP